MEVGGIFSNNQSINGEFYNWNVAYLMYCDGGSFSGYRYSTILISYIFFMFYFCTREEPIVVGGTKLYIRLVCCSRNYLQYAE